MFFLCVCFYTNFRGEGNGTPLQYSCLENPMDGGAWLASVHGVAKRHDWATSLSLFTFIHWRRKWQPSPVFLPGESQGQQSLVGCRHGVTQSRTRLKWLSSSSSIQIFELFVLVLWKNAIGILTGIALNLQIALSSIIILTILILAIPEHGAFPFVCVVFSFSHQCLTDFWVQVFWLLSLICPQVFYSFWCNYKWDCFLTFSFW